MQNIVRSFLVFLLFLLPLAAYAHNRVVVVPLSGDDIEPLSNIVTVAKRNGDFSNPLAAMASITDASASNPYLIVIAPGVYNLDGQLVMKEFVNIAGSGKEVTTLTGNVSTTSVETAALVVAANNVSIQDLKIVNNGTGGLFSTTIFSGGSNINLSNVELDANNSIATAIRGNNGCRYQLNDVEINMPRRSSSVEEGIRLENCTINMQGGSINISSDGSTNTDNVTGVFLDGPRDAVISNVDMRIVGGNSVNSEVIGLRIVGDGFATNEFPSIRLSDLKLNMVSFGSPIGVDVQGNGSAITIDAMHMQILTNGGGLGYESVDMNTTISNSTIIVQGQGGDIVGISQFATPNGSDSFSILSTNVLLAATGPVGSVGVENLGVGSNQTMIVRDSRIEADTSIQAQGNAPNNRTYVSDSIISGNVVGEPICDFVFTTIGQSLDNNCGVPQSQ